MKTEWPRIAAENPAPKAYIAKEICRLSASPAEITPDLSLFALFSLDIIDVNLSKDFLFNSLQLNFVFRLIVNTIIPSNIRIELPNKLVISGEITVRMRWPIVIDKLTIVPDASMMIRSAGSVNRI